MLFEHISHMGENCVESELYEKQVKTQWTPAETKNEQTVSLNTGKWKHCIMQSHQQTNK